MNTAYRMRGVFKGFKIAQHETSVKGLHLKLLLQTWTKTREKWPYICRDAFTHGREHIMKTGFNSTDLEEVFPKFYETNGIEVLQLSSAIFQEGETSAPNLENMQTPLWTSMEDRFTLNGWFRFSLSLEFLNKSYTRKTQCFKGPVVKSRGKWKVSFEVYLQAFYLDFCSG